MARNAFVLVFAAYHEACDILQEHQRDTALRAQFDEMRAFLGGFREQHAVVGDDADGAAFEMGKARDQCFPEAGFKFIKA